MENRMAEIEKRWHDWGKVEERDFNWLMDQVKKLNDFAYKNEKGEPKITTKELVMLLVDFKLIKKENEELKNAGSAETMEEVKQLKRENERLKDKLNNIIELINK